VLITRSSGCGTAAAVAGEGGVSGALHLESLHAREEIEELRGEWVAVEAGGRKGEEEFVRRLERGGQPSCGCCLMMKRLGAVGVNVSAREFLETRAEPEHFAGAAQGAVEEEEHEATAAARRERGRRW